jgi:hypothetical protein
MSAQPSVAISFTLGRSCQALNPYVTVLCLLQHPVSNGNFLLFPAVPNRKHAEISQHVLLRTQQPRLDGEQVGQSAGHFARVALQRHPSRVSIVTALQDVFQAATKPFRPALGPGGIRVHIRHAQREPCAPDGCRTTTDLSFYKRPSLSTERVWLTVVWGNTQRLCPNATHGQYI